MKLLLSIKSLPTKEQIWPYISQKNDRLANSLLSLELALNGYVSSSSVHANLKILLGCSDSRNQGKSLRGH